GSLDASRGVGTCVAVRSAAMRLPGRSQSQLDRCSAPDWPSESWLIALAGETREDPDNCIGKRGSRQKCSEPYSDALCELPVVEDNRKEEDLATTGLKPSLLKQYSTKGGTNESHLCSAGAAHDCGCWYTDRGKRSLHRVQ